ncbi:MAG: hypothetical protein JRH20_21765, partial [Deltaproteobacteria bacterium]|nr:hypothetical protein [Deltaproteobacteria bacterium]
MAQTLSALMLVGLAAFGCEGFRAAGGDALGMSDVQSPDQAVDLFRADASEIDASEIDGAAAPDAGLAPCPDGLSAPIITRVDASAVAVALATPTTLSVSADDAAGLGLRVDFRASAGTFTVGTFTQGTHTASWQLDQGVPLDFFTTTYTLDVEVTHACQGSPSSLGSVKVDVYGNVLVTNSRRDSLEVFGSNGSHLGRLVDGSLGGPAAMLLLSREEIAVSSFADKDVKVVRLSDGKVLRSFGGGVAELSPRYLDRLSDGSVLVAPVNDNQIVRMDPQSGALLKTITVPHTYGLAGLTHLADDTIISGISGTGRFYKNPPDGSLGTLFFTITNTYDTYTIRGLARDEILVSTMDWNYNGVLVRIDSHGEEIERKVHSGFHAPTPETLTPFIGGFLFTH